MGWARSLIRIPPPERIKYSINIWRILSLALESYAPSRPLYFYRRYFVEL